MESNHVKVSRGLRILRDALSTYVARELKIEFADKWWEYGVLDILREDQRRNLPSEGDWATLVDSLDVFLCLLLFDLHWRDVFRKKLSVDHRTWAKELVGVRHKVAHLGGDDFSDDDTWRYLDNMSRLLEQIDPEGASEIRVMQRIVRYGTDEGSATATSAPVLARSRYRVKSKGVMTTTPVQGLPGWRHVMEPHPDVAQGRYRNAEFAADLAQVARGEASVEYQDPVEFYSRTYITEGMTGLLVQSLRRLLGKGGEPVIQLKTAFGGGKTHSMLALYHAARGNVSVSQIPNIKPILEQVGVASFPKANVVVLVGTAIDPNKSKRPAYLPGSTVNTLWGEIAAQLVEATGRVELYDHVKLADKNGVSPGSLALARLFDDAGSCLILIDELVAYAKKLYGAKGLPAGSFDNLMTFIQEISEATRASRNSLVVASIPESDIEIGGEAGKIALDTIQHVFGRMESIWHPVAPNEGFEVVRRRLFLECKDPEVRDAVCRAFGKMYRDNSDSFPFDTKEASYEERLLSCYPIHPEVFDRLYADWASLEKFQRTRGVLRLMAAVIHELWMDNDASLMIMPGSFPLDVPSVRDELTRYLSEGWNAIIDAEIDGGQSVPFEKDQGARFAPLIATRRVARTIMLGSAPTSAAQNIRGIESPHIRLGVVQPGENISVFNDALFELRNSLTYLYHDSMLDRYWYDTRPTLRKTAEQRAERMQEDIVDEHIISVLKQFHRAEGPFQAVHIGSLSTYDVPDEQSFRLVILHPKQAHGRSIGDSAAVQFATACLQNRGDSHRKYKNMLAFLAPDFDGLVTLRREVKRFLSWQSIDKDKDSLNLDVAQNREVQDNLQRSKGHVLDQVREAYSWLLIPEESLESVGEIRFEKVRLSSSQGSVAAKAGRYMIQNELVIEQLGAYVLKKELDDLLWNEQKNDKDHIEISVLWNQLCSYCYLPRLSKFQVLLDAISLGLRNTTDYFAYATAYDGEVYIDLHVDRVPMQIERSGLLVKSTIARSQVEQQQTKTDPVIEPVDLTRPPEAKDKGEREKELIPRKKHFFLNKRMDPLDLVSEIHKLTEEVVTHLVGTQDAKISITVNVDVVAPLGFPYEIERAVKENCQTLGVETFEFDD